MAKKGDSQMAIDTYGKRQMFVLGLISANAVRRIIEYGVLYEVARPIRKPVFLPHFDVSWRCKKCCSSVGAMALPWFNHLPSFSFHRVDEELVIFSSASGHKLF